MHLNAFAAYRDSVGRRSGVLELPEDIVLKWQINRQKSHEFLLHNTWPAPRLMSGSLA
jgi:hypothetical protein